MTPPVTRTALVELLRSARRQQGWSIRRAAGAAGVAPSTVQGWFEGRHLPTPALTGNFLDLLTALALIESDADREAWLEALGAIRGGPVNAEPPYVGLRAYTSDDAALYFGRERALSELIQACVRGERVGAVTVILIGDSGAGKSSLLGAGLVGRAAAPGGPLAGLRPCWVEPANLPEFVVPDEPCLLRVDQFEEAQKLPEERQRAIFDALAGLPDQATVVIALTADAFGFAMRDDRLAAHLDSHVRVSSLTEAEYRRIIEEPARRHGRQISPALTTLLLHDLLQYGEPVAGTVLPLLSSVLRRCWMSSTGDEIRTQTYLGTGGLWAAVDETAEDVYASLDADQRRLVRRLMLSLVRVEGSQILRRRIPAETLDPQMALISDRFVAARLLVQRDGQLSIAHDALLRQWERLKAWADEESASLLIGRRIHMATQVWDEGGRAPEALLPAEAALWQEWAQSETAPLLSDTERDFIDSSLARAEEDEASHRRTIRRLRSRQAVAVVALVIALTMAASALAASARSDRFRLDAEAATRSAQARQIALVAGDVRPITPNLAAQLSLASLKLDESVDTRSAVAKSAGNPVPARATGPAGNTMVAFLPAGKGVVRADSSGTVSLWRDGDLSAQPETFRSGGRQLFVLEVTRSAGRSLLFVGGQQTASVWDVSSTPTKRGEFGNGKDEVTYSADWRGSTILFGMLDGQIRRVDIGDPDAPRPLAPLSIGAGSAVTALAATDDLIVAGGRPGLLDVFSADGTPLGSQKVTDNVLGLDVSPDGTRIASALSGLRVDLWRSTPDGLLADGGWDLPAGATTVRHLGDRMFVAGFFGEVRSYDLDGTLLRSWPERTATVSLDVRDDQLLVGSTEGATSLWNVSDGDPIVKVTTGRVFDVLRGGDVALIGSTSGARPYRRDGAGWVATPMLATGSPVEYNPYYGLSGDGLVLVNQTRDGRLVTFARDGDAYRQIGMMDFPKGLADLRLSPEGRYLAIGYQGRSGYELFRRDGGTWAPFGSVDGWPSGCTFPGEDLFVAMGREGQDFGVWDLAGAKPEPMAQLDTVGKEVPVAFAAASDGRLAVGDSAGEITVYSMADPHHPKVAQRLGDARSSISQVGFSADGNRLLASTREGKVWVWRLEGDDATLDLQLAPDSASVQGVAALGSDIVMTLSDGRAVAWPLYPREEVDELCAHLGTDLTPEEWDRLVPGVPFLDGCTGG